MPVRHILLSNPWCYIKHYDGTLGLDVTAISQPTKCLLMSHIPYIELNRSSLGMEHPRWWTSTPKVATYFSGSPGRWRFTNIVFPVLPSPATQVLAGLGVLLGQPSCWCFQKHLLPSDWPLLFLMYQSQYLTQVYVQTGDMGKVYWLFIEVFLKWTECECLLLSSEKNTPQYDRTNNVTEYFHPKII